jgi:dihydrofolate reductase
VISLVVAMTPDRVIGVDNRLPWHLPADLRHFKVITMGKALLMGRRTYESIGRPLPGRTNIVVTRDPAFSAPGCLVVHSLQEALTRPERGEELMVIGGAACYEQLLPQAQRIYLTVVEADLPGDTRFPALDPAQWREVAREPHAPDERNRYPYTFLVLERGD